MRVGWTFFSSLFYSSMNWSRIKIFIFFLHTGEVLWATSKQCRFVEILVGEGEKITDSVAAAAIVEARHQPFKAMTLVTRSHFDLFAIAGQTTSEIMSRFEWNQLEISYIK